MLVEDDNNLREIYEARLAAEGYEIVSAHDGEEALAIAVKEQPDLIISDIMMPKISGFDMLDILRSTPETHDTKIVMMTALSQAEDKERAGKLGADKYLVKSQVTLEDVVRVAKELLDGANMVDPASPATNNNEAPATVASDSTIPVTAPPDAGPSVDTSVPPAPASTDAAVPAPVAAPVDDTATTAPQAHATDATTVTPADDVAAANPAPSDDAVASPPADTTPAAQPAADPVNPVAATSTSDQPDTGSTDDPEPVPAAATPPAASSVEDQIKDFISTAEQVKNNANVPASTPSATPTQIPVTSPEETTPAAEAPAEPQLATPSGQKKVIEPINDLSQGGPDLDALLAKEETKPADTTTPVPSVNTVISPDGTLSYASAPPSEAAPAAEQPTLATPPEAGDTPAQEPHQPGQKIDPDSVAL